MNSKFVLLCSLIVLSSVGYAQLNANNDELNGNNINHTFCYTNPITRDTSISMRDHCIIRVGEKWYCTGTSNPVRTVLNN